MPSLIAAPYPARRHNPLSAALLGLARTKRRYVALQNRHRAIMLALQLVYVVMITAALDLTHSWPAPDVVAAFLLLFAVVAGRGVTFLRDWSPFILLLLGYVALGGVADGVVAKTHMDFPIRADRWLAHGAIPTLWLQHRLFIPGHPHWYDYLAVLTYPMHFIVPLALAFVLWFWRRPAYWRFAASYLLLVYAGLLTYLFYPMAPPWWAYRYHRLPPVHLILYEVHYGGVRAPIVLAARATWLFHSNEVAAMPSIHAATPALVWLVAWRLWPRWGWATVLYPLLMAWAVVYLGEHYAVDCVAGFAYAAGAFAIVYLSPAAWRLLRRRSATTLLEPATETA